MRRPYFICAAGVLLLALWVGLRWHGRQQAVVNEEQIRAAVLALGPRLRVARVAAAGPSRTISLPGDVRALHQVTLYAKISGYLRELRVDRGDRVTAGQILGRVASPETDGQVRSSRVTEADKAQVQSRYRSLVDRGVVSKLDMDRADADARVAAAESERLQILVDYETLRAPFAGIISARYVDAGALVSAATGATQSAQPILDLVDASKVRIYVYLNQAEAAHVAAGDPVHISSPDDPEIDRDAQISRIGGALDPRSRTMMTEIDVDNVAGRILPGTFVQVSLQVRADPAPSIPTEAVMLRQGETFAAVVQDNHVHFRRIDLAGSDGIHQRVRRGLAPGEVVALYAGDVLEDGAAVQPVGAP